MRAGVSTLEETLPDSLRKLVNCFNMKRGDSL